MKKLVTSIMATAMILGVSSCGDHDFEAPVSYNQQVQDNFDRAFVEAFGHVYPDQDWGFGDGTETKAALTRSIDADANEWFSPDGDTRYELDPNVTSEEKLAVFNWVNKPKSEVEEKVQLEYWTDFFVSQVWNGYTDEIDGQPSTALTNSYLYSTGSDGQIISIYGPSYYMQYLNCKDEDGNLEHNDKFNNATNNLNQSYKDDEGNTQYVVGKSLMLDSGTSDFLYYNTYSSTWRNDYIVVSGASIFGAESDLAGYYYVCFDFNNPYTEDEKANEKTFINLTGAYEKWQVVKEGTPEIPATEGTDDKNVEISFTMDGADYSNYFATPEDMGLDVLSLVKNNNNAWQSWNYPSGSYVSAVSNVTITITESLNSQYNKYTKYTITGNCTVTTPGTPGTPAIPATPDEYGWVKVKEYNDSQIVSGGSVTGFYEDSDLTFAKIMELIGETPAADVENPNPGEVREVSGNEISARILGYSTGDKHFEGDHIYTDWIVRISPAIVKGESGSTPVDDGTVTTRVFVEDLFATSSTYLAKSDWDFNDVVFDVVYHPANGSTAQYSEVILQAAGGTLELKLFCRDQEREVHDAFGVPTTTMVNTSPVTIDPVPIFTFPGEKVTASEVEVRVNHGEGKGWVTITAFKGEPAAKFAAKLTNKNASYKWPGERVHIENVFPNYTKWATTGETLQVIEDLK